ncbi:MAG: cold shock domain-containing protein [Methylobacter sp.]
MAKTTIKGVLKTWKEDRGFGFISPDDGGKDIFIHISALKGAGRRPLTGDIIHYQVAKDSGGKLKAVNASIEGVSMRQNKVSSRINLSKQTLFAIAAAVVAIVAAAVALNLAP